ncbi:LysM peptidoglycan-binding domain-containing protein [Bacillus sp. KH172YL63]|uniref:LysM peptidoglycan-binding domain-containing protein n=1 Tax=Bacillus sp. KH172YL63 TaxID=2709784 RepID=UPI0013E4664D|nr:LysM peptidoglycan-binding domain-containing protein [Bacillus sp. KH172YL63]BCB02951.1 germination protein [Bacillus sp. KH172YL63]
MNIYVVKSGDSLWSIASRYGVEINQILYGNQLKNPNILVIGQCLLIPEPLKEYIIEPGDTLSGVSQKYGIGIDELIAFNQITDPSRLFVGQLIVLPAFIHEVRSGESLYTISYNHKVPLEDVLKANAIPNPSLIYPQQQIRIPNPKPVIAVNAYTTRAEGEGAAEVNGLSSYFSYLSPFTHTITKEGSMTELNDAALISVSKNGDVDPLLVLTNYRDGKFNSDLAATILRSDSLQDALIASIVKKIEDKGYTGLNIDFEYIYPEDREHYNRFLRKTVASLKPKGYSVSTALAPKTKGDQKGLLYEAHDYKAHGEIVDFVVLMTYEWGWAGGKPWAIAPINEVKKVLDYAVTVIPRKKIMMGTPLYGRDWKIPWKEGTFAKTISPQGAVDLAAQYGVRIRYNEQYQSPYFTYWDREGQQHEVWFEDARSMLAKQKTLDDYQLKGLSYWVLGSAFPQNWMLQHARYRVEK